MTVTCCTLALIGLIFAAQEAPKPEWIDYKPSIPPLPKRWNPRLPLSDQKNAGKWVRYEPMSDEFDGAKLDASKWFDHNPTWKGRQPGWFSPSNVTVSGGMLHLAMRLEEPPAEARAEGYRKYTSAAVQSKDASLYGYYEVRARAMKSAGSSSFWFYKADPDIWTEIDVFEIGGRAPGFERKLNMTVHVMRTPTEKNHLSWGGAFLTPTNLADDFHVYGLEWNREEIKFYFDGVLVRKGRNTHWTQALTLNFDSETMPEWFGLPKDEDLPSVYDIDYVRAWKQQEPAK
jgi:beta-glucanase (GH16 family)